MARLEWSDELSVGVAKIDDQHRELIRMANGLINAVSLGRERKVLENVFRRLREYTVFHFRSEEALMEELRYDKRAVHAQEHQQLKERVKEFQRTLYLHEELTPQRILGFMKEWMLKHILQSDRDIIRFIHEQEKEAEAAMAERKEAQGKGSEASADG